MANYSNVKHYSPLSIFTFNENKDNLALIVTDSNFNGCAKITSLIESLWNVARYRIVTSSGQNLVSSFKMSSSNCSNILDLGKNEAGNFNVSSEDKLSNIMQNLLELKQRNYVNINNLLILSNKTFSIYQILNFVGILFAYTEKFLECDVSVSGIFGHSFVCILPSGSHELNVDTSYEGAWCGLIPLGYPATVTATGLEWNLNKLKLHYGGFVSSSNVLDGSGKVNISNDKSVAWTMAIKCSDVVHTTKK